MFGRLNTGDKLWCWQCLLILYVYINITWKVNTHTHSGAITKVEWMGIFKVTPTKIYQNHI